MCGICGFVGFEDQAPNEELLQKMTDCLQHRGPDDFGYFRDESVHLGFRRLSIIDLAGGHQPMTSPDGSLVIIFNGEIYNYQQLRSDLQQRGNTFFTSSDTEPIFSSTALISSSTQPP